MSQRTRHIIFSWFFAIAAVFELFLAHGHGVARDWNAMGISLVAMFICIMWCWVYSPRV